MVEAAATSARSGTRRLDVPIERIEVSAYTIPTDFPESDGTLEWDSTTLVLVEAVLGRPGIAATAIAAVDTALWDLKARLLDLPLVRLGLDFKRADAARFAVPF